VNGTEPRSNGTTNLLPRCPLASTRAPRDAMAACPGYSRETVQDLSVAGHTVANPGTTCGHLGAEPLATGRYVPACHHPEAAWITRAASTMLRGVPA
jgi:hypothetical protein